jgi:hydrogenase maturation factor
MKANSCQVNHDDLNDGHCITCSDEALPARVLQVDAALAIAQVEMAGARSEVDISLVDSLVPGDLVLVHGGIVLTQLVTILIGNELDKCHYTGIFADSGIVCTHFISVEYK